MTMPAISLAAVSGRRQQTLDIAAEIERRGFTGIYCPSMGDCVALCQSIASVTNEITFGTSVQPIYFRNPEDLAATAVWGSQQVGLFEGAKYDGVFGMWYGKGPGVDRSMDVIKHANAFGTSKYGGVLAVAGDDHAAKSSTLPHQSEHMFIGASIPVLNPANVQEVLDLGVYGW